MYCQQRKNWDLRVVWDNNDPLQDIIELAWGNTDQLYANIKLD